MESGLHHKLAEDINKLLEEHLASNGFSGFDINSFYLGNWIADFSQALDEGVKYLIVDLILEPTSFAGAIKDLLVDRLTKLLSNENLFYLINKGLKSLIDLPDDLRKDPIRLRMMANDYETTPETLLHTLEDLRSKIQAVGEITKDNLAEKALGAQEAMKDILKEMSLMSSDLSSAISDLLSFMRLEKDYGPFRFHSLEEAKSSGYLGAIEFALFNIVRFLGLKKFKAGLTGEISLKTFNAVVEKMLTPYSPVHHLDRPLDFDKIKNRSSAQIEEYYLDLLVDDFQFDLTRDKLQQEGYLDINKKLEDTQVYLAENGLDRIEELDFITSLDVDNHIAPYPYLQEQLLVACSQLSEVERFLKEEAGTAKDDELNIALARLGKAIHIFEDFFSHSNYVEFSLLTLYQLLDSPKLNSCKYKGVIKALFAASEKNSVALSNIEVNRLVRSLVRAESNPAHLDRQISTGFFGDDDTKISLFHILVGVLREKISSLEEDTPYTSSVYEGLRKKAKEGVVNLAGPFLAVEDLEAWQKKLEAEKQRQLNLIQPSFTDTAEDADKYNRKKKALEKKYDEEIDIIKEKIKSEKELYERIVKISKHIKKGFVPSAEDPPLYFPIEELAKLLDGLGYSKEQVESLGKAINYFLLAKDIYGASKNIAEKYKFVYLLLKSIQTFLRVIRILAQYPGAWYRIATLFTKKVWGIVNENLLFTQILIRYPLEWLIVEIIEHLKDFKLRDAEYTSGSHSLMAKDEKYEKPHLNEFAMNLASYLDKVILENLFSNIPEKKQYTEWLLLLPLYFVNYTHINDSILPNHRVEKVNEAHRLIALSGDESRTSWMRHALEKLIRQNLEPYDAVSAVLEKLNDDVQPLRIQATEHESHQEIDLNMLRLYNYQIILGASVEPGNVKLPKSLDKKDVLDFIGRGTEIGFGLQEKYIDAMLTKIYLKQEKTILQKVSEAIFD